MSNIALPIEPITLNYLNTTCPDQGVTVKFKEYPQIKMYLCEGQFGISAVSIHINVGTPDIELAHVMQWGDVEISFSKDNHIYLTAEKFTAGNGYAKVLTLIDADLSMSIEG